MKFLGLLALIQIGLFVALFTRLDAFEERVEMLTETTGETRNNQPLTTPLPQNTPTIRQAGFEIPQLRRIVREELQAVLNASVLTKQDSTATTNFPISDEAEMLYQRDLVIEELEFLKTQDKVSNAEIEQFMGDVAQLQPETRSELLKMFNRAINRGEIRGQL